MDVTKSIEGKKLVEAFRSAANGDLGNEGLIAGGAVSMVYVAMAHGVNSSTKDIDVFRITHQYSEQTEETRFSGFDLVNASYGSICLINNFYSIVKSEMKGIVNEVTVYTRQKDYQQILKGFDLNCTQGGVAIETGECFLTEDFLEFLETRQLKVCSVNSPGHTVLRLLRKKEALKCFCNLPEQLGYLAHVPQILDKSPLRRTEAPLYCELISMADYVYYLEYKELIDRYFQVVIVNDNFFTMKPVYMDTKLMAELSDCQSITDIQTKWRLIQRRKPEAKKNMIVLGHGGLSRDFLFVNPDYAQCDFHEKHLNTIDAFMHRHPYMLDIFKRLKLNISGQLNAIKVINKASEKYGVFIVGLIESADRDNLPEAITEDWIAMLANNYKAEYPGPLKEPEDLTGFPYLKMVQELVTADSLIREGALQHHCVGGYCSRVKERSSIIFHLETADGEVSTIQFARQYHIQTLATVQHKGKYNSEPSVVHQILGTMLENYLNKLEFLENGKPLTDMSAAQMIENTGFVLNSQTTSTLEEYWELARRHGTTSLNCLAYTIDSVVKRIAESYIREVELYRARSVQVENEMLEEDEEEPYLEEELAEDYEYEVLDEEELAALDAGMMGFAATKLEAIDSGYGAGVSCPATEKR